MARVGVHQAKTRFSELLRRVSGGEEILIMRGGETVAKLVPAGAARPGWLGMDVGLVSIGEDFGAPLPEELAAGFEG